MVKKKDPDVIVSVKMPRSMRDALCARSPSWKRRKGISQMIRRAISQWLIQ